MECLSWLIIHGILKLSLSLFIVVYHCGIYISLVLSIRVSFGCQGLFQMYRRVSSKRCDSTLI